MIRFLLVQALCTACGAPMYYYSHRNLALTGWFMGTIWWLIVATGWIHSTSH